MARKLKTYRTSIGFFDQVIAAVLKAALEAWGANSNLFHPGAAKESHDADVIAATMAKLRASSSSASWDQTVPSASTLNCPRTWVMPNNRRKPAAGPGRG
jgi:hypothetical protein